jgi:hypothetical protein
MGLRRLLDRGLSFQDAHHQGHPSLRRPALDLVGSVVRHRRPLPSVIESRLVGGLTFAGSRITHAFLYFNRITPPRSGRVGTSTIVLANAAGVKSETRRPISGELIISGTPPVLAVSTGAPHAITSTETIPKGSARVATTNLTLPKTHNNRPALCTMRAHTRSCPTRYKDLLEHAKRLFGGPAPRIALRAFIGLGNQGLSVAHVL